jgi:hypothetical protein
VRAGAQARRLDVPVDVAVPVVCRRAPAAPKRHSTAPVARRTLAFKTFVWLAANAPGALREPADENSFIKLARQGKMKHDDLLELVTLQRLRGQIADAGFAIVHEHLHVTKTFRNLPAPIARWLRESPLTQDIVIGNMEYVLRH